MGDEKRLKARVAHKHKTEAEWYLDVYTAADSTTKRSDPFIPLDGELIIFDTDESNTKKRFKFGDGKTDVIELPFVTSIKNIIDTGTSGVSQIPDNVADGFDFTGKNPNATELDPSLTGKIAYGATGAFASAFGGKSAAMGKRSHAEGTTTIAKGSYSHAEGSDSAAIGETSHAEGWKATAYGAGAHAEGKNTLAGSAYSHAEGVNSRATNEAAHAEGYNTYANGYASHTEGRSNIADGNHAHAEGNSTRAPGLNSHSEGEETHANGYASHAEGRGPTAAGEASHAEGLYTKALADYSHTEGDNNTVSTDAEGGHAEGKGNTVTGAYAHAEGSHNTVSGLSAHVEGQHNTVTGDYAHASGTKNHVTNSGAHALGIGLKAYGENQIVLGKYNLSHENAILIVGNGTDDDNRSNALVVYPDGKSGLLNKDTYGSTYGTWLDSNGFYYRTPEYAMGADEFSIQKSGIHYYNVTDGMSGQLAFPNLSGAKDTIATQGWVTQNALHETISSNSGTLSYHEGSWPYQPGFDLSSGHLSLTWSIDCHTDYKGAGIDYFAYDGSAKNYSWNFPLGESGTFVVTDSNGMIGRDTVIKQLLLKEPGDDPVYNWGSNAYYTGKDLRISSYDESNYADFDVKLDVYALQFTVYNDSRATRAKYGEEGVWLTFGGLNDNEVKLDQNGLHFDSTYHVATHYNIEGIYHKDYLPSTDPADPGNTTPYEAIYRFPYLGSNIDGKPPVGTLLCKENLASLTGSDLPGSMGGLVYRGYNGSLLANYDEYIDYYYSDMYSGKHYGKLVVNIDMLNQATSGFLKGGQNRFYVNDCEIGFGYEEDGSVPVVGLGCDHSAYIKVGYDYDSGNAEYRFPYVPYYDWDNGETYYNDTYTLATTNMFSISPKILPNAYNKIQLKAGHKYYITSSGCKIVDSNGETHSEFSNSISTGIIVCGNDGETVGDNSNHNSGQFRGFIITMSDLNSTSRNIVLNEGEYYIENQSSSVAWIYVEGPQANDIIVEG